MATQEYYINRSTHKHNLFGIVGTILIHGFIFLFLFLYVMYPPNPPLEFQGMMMSLGDENMGGPSESPVPDPQPAEQYVPISEQTEETPLTSEEEESVAIKEKSEAKPKEIKENKPPNSEKKPQLELPKKINQQALFKPRNKNTGEGGRGDGEIPGNQGEPDGDPNGDPDGHGGGLSGDGSGDSGPDGISYNLANRKVRQLPNIEDHSKSVGKVVVSITVNKNGEVIKAVPGQVNSTTTDPILLEKAKEGALKTKFSPRGNGSDDQYGTMTFIFRFKP